MPDPRPPLLGKSAGSFNHILVNSGFGFASYLSATSLVLPSVDKTLFANMDRSMKEGQDFLRWDLPIRTDLSNGTDDGNVETAGQATPESSLNETSVHSTDVRDTTSEIMLSGLPSSGPEGHNTSAGTLELNELDVAEEVLRSVLKDVIQFCADKKQSDDEDKQNFLKYERSFQIMIAHVKQILDLADGLKKDMAYMGRKLQSLSYQMINLESAVRRLVEIPDSETFCYNLESVLFKIVEIDDDFHQFLTEVNTMQKKVSDTTPDNNLGD